MYFTILFKYSNLACHFHEGVILEVDLVTSPWN